MENNCGRVDFRLKTIRVIAGSADCVTHKGIA